MKKMCVCMVIAYIVLMIFVASTVLSQDILYITPVIVGVIFAVYAVVLIYREKNIMTTTDEELMDVSLGEYEAHVKKYIEYVEEINKRYSYLRHDMANHTQVIMEMVDVDKCPEKEQLIEEIKTILNNNKKVRYSDNSIVNSTLWVKLKSIEQLGYSIENDINLYGLKHMECRVLCYNLYFLLDMMTRQMDSNCCMKIKMTIKDSDEEKVRISYKVQNYNVKVNYKRFIWSYDYISFKELTEAMNGTVICDVNNTVLTVAGWMEVQKNV